MNISVAGGLFFGVAYLLDGAMHNDIAERRAACRCRSRMRCRNSGSPRAACRAAERHARRRVGERGDEVGHQQLPRQRVRVPPRQAVQRHQSCLPRSIRRPASAATTGCCATSSAARSAGRSCATSCSSSAATRARPRVRRRPTTSPTCRPRRCWPATSRRSPRRRATAAGRSRCARRS